MSSKAHSQTARAGVHTSASKSRPTSMSASSKQEKTVAATTRTPSKQQAKSSASSATSPAASLKRKQPPAPTPDEDEEEETYSEPEEVGNEDMQQEMMDEEEGEDDGEDDDDEMDGNDDDGDDEDGDATMHATSAPSSTSNKKSKKSFILPTSEEVSALRQTEELFHSNLFKLSLDELLQEIRVDYSTESGKIKKIEPILHELKDMIEKMDSGVELKYDAEKPAFGAEFPGVVAASAAVAANANSASSSAASSQQHTFHFSPPTSFHLVGSYPLRTILKDTSSSQTATMNIDIALTIPSDIVKPKDYWDYRYLAKRARYLQHIAESLMTQYKGKFLVKVGKMRGAVEKPVLLLYPQKLVAETNTYVPYTGLLSKVVIRVFIQLPSAAEGNSAAAMWNQKRFHPGKCNVHEKEGVSAKEETMKQENGTNGKKKPITHDEEANLHTGSPTPYYNSLLLSDMFYTTHLTQLYDLMQIESVRETVLLLKLWSKQRRLEQGRAGVGAGNGTGAQEARNGGWGEYDLVWSDGGDGSNGDAVKAENGNNNKKGSAKKKKQSLGGNNTSSTSSQPRLLLTSPTHYTSTLPSTLSGFNGFFFSILLLHLYKTKAVYKSMSTFQVFKQVLNALVKMEFGVSGEQNGGVLLGYDPNKSTLQSLSLLTNPLNSAAVLTKEQELLHSWRSVQGGSELLFLNEEGTQNYLSHVSAQAMMELKQEAFLSLTLLDDTESLVQQVLAPSSTTTTNGTTTAEASNKPTTLHSLLSLTRPLPSSVHISNGSSPGTGSASSSATDNFSLLFMTPIQYHMKYDAYLRVKCGKKNEWMSSSRQLSKTLASFMSSHDQAGLSRDADPLSLYVRQVQKVLELALTDRIVLMHVKTRFDQDEQLLLEIGFLLHPIHSPRILDSGPSADQQPQATYFRQLWGDMSTLRRFKDGQIVEAVVWTTPAGGNTGAAANVPHTSPHLIPFQIITYILQRHFSLPQDRVEVIFSQFESLLKLRKIESEPSVKERIEKVQKEEMGVKLNKTSSHASSSNTLHLSPPLIDPLLSSSTSSLFSNYQSLSTTLKTLKNLPLSIINIRMVSEHARYTSVFQVQPIDMMKLAPANSKITAHSISEESLIPILLQFETSNKWPEDSLAISRIKSAFYIQFGKLLQEQHDIQSLVEIDSLLIIYHGYVFKMKIYTPEHELRVRQAEEKLGLMSLGTPMIPVLTSKQIQRELVWKPQLAQQLKFLQESYALFAPTVRLVKRWLSSHMFSPFLLQHTPEAVELLVAHLFTNPKPYNTPGSALQGLHRWLKWIGQFDFTECPVVVDLSGSSSSSNSPTGSDLTPEVIEKIHSRFMQHRLNGTGSLIYIATRSDLEGEMVWRRKEHDGKSKEIDIDQTILDRIKQYARSSGAYFDTLLSTPSTSATSPSTNTAAHYKSLFKTPLTVPQTYDALIHLRADQLSVFEWQKSVAPGKEMLTSGAAEDGKKKYKLSPDATQSLIEFSSTGSTSSTSLPLLGFSPVSMYLSSLHHLFGSRAYFFFDGQGGSVIGVKWREEFRKECEQKLMKWSVKQAGNSIPVWSGSEKSSSSSASIVGVRVHLEELYADMKRAGLGLVERIETA